MKVFKILLKSLTFILLSINAQAQNRLESTTVIYYGGNIVTMEGDAPSYVKAVVVKDGIIAYVGKLDEVKKGCLIASFATVKIVRVRKSISSLKSFMDFPKFLQV